MLLLARQTALRVACELGVRPRAYRHRAAAHIKLA